MIQVTTWKPDTCGCIVQYEWDDLTSEDVRIHSLRAMDNICNEHMGLSDQEVFDALFHENTCRNIALGIISNKFSALTKQVVDNEGNISTAFQNGKKPIHSFNQVKSIDLSQVKALPNELVSKSTVKARAIVLDIPDLSDPEKIQCQALLDGQFGAGIITVQ